MTVANKVDRYDLLQELIYRSKPELQYARNRTRQLILNDLVIGRTSF